VPVLFTHHFHQLDEATGTLTSFDALYGDGHAA
jgi:hypothetical protein